MRASQRETSGVALLFDETAIAAPYPSAWFFEHVEALRDFRIERGVNAAGGTQSLPVNVDHVVRLSHQGQLTVWLLGEPALQEALDALSSSGAISRATDDMAFESGQDALTVIPADKGLPRQWHVHAGIESVYDVIGAEPMMRSRV